MHRKLLVLAAAATALACGRQDPGASGEGRVAFTAATRVHGESATIPSVCATFTLTPYALDAAGAWVGPAGAPVSITSTPSGPATSAILGCTASGHAPDWGYLVTATAFNDCAGHAIPGLSPSVVSTRESLTCAAGFDTALAITVDVAIAQPNNAGYLDLTTTVEVTNVAVGCKNADIDDGGTLHFGETSLSAADAGVVAPLGFTSISLSDADGGAAVVPPAAVNQFAGLISGAGQQGPYYTGLVSLAQPGAWDVLQTFAQPCVAPLYYAATLAPQCDTTVTAAGEVSTAARLADAFVLVPGQGWVSAVIEAPASIALWYGTSAALSDPNRPPVTHWNPQRKARLAFSAPVAGLYVDQQHPGALLAVLSPQSGPEVQRLSPPAPSGQWAAASLGPLSSFTAAQLQAMGLFQQLPAGCRKQVQ
jgi:hypothetical protein